MRVVSPGSLEHFAAKDLLTFLGSSHIGTFVAESGSERLRLAFATGNIVASRETAMRPASLRNSSSGATERSAFSMTSCSRGCFADRDRGGHRRGRGAQLPQQSLSQRQRQVPRGQPPAGRDQHHRRGVPDPVPDRDGKSLAQLRAESGRTADDLYPVIKRLQMTG